MRYVPGNVPTAVDGRAIYSELVKIQAALDALYEGQMEILYNEPNKLRDGMVVYADGTDWDPDSLGLGEGVYARVAGAWTKL